MSVKVSTRVWEHSRATGSALLVLLAIADHAHNADGTEAWPSMTNLATKVRLHRRQVQKLVDRLEALGELHVEPVSGKASRLAVSIQCPLGVCITGHTLREQRRGAEYTPPVSPSAQGGALQDTGTCVAEDTQTVTTTVPRNPQEPFPPKAAAAQRSERTNEDEFVDRTGRARLTYRGALRRKHPGIKDAELDRLDPRT